MAKSLSSLTSSKSTNPPVITLYGSGGMGKTSLASEFPNPVYLHTAGESTPTGVDIPAVQIDAYDDLTDMIGDLLSSDHDFKTVIIDSIDGFEPLVWAATCRRLKVNTIEEPGYGKGYKEADEEWKFLIEGLLALKQSGILVVVLAHYNIKRFDSPTSDPFDRYNIKLHDRASALIREKSDVVAFIKQRFTIKEKALGGNVKVAHGEGSGEREIFLEERPGFLAKNRYDMPPKVTYKKGEGYTTLSQYFPAPTGIRKVTENV